MTNAEKIALVKTMCDETNDAVISAYLFMAGKRVIALCCSDNTTEVPERWDALHVDITVYLLNKRGAEGESSHSENGIGRSYESADVPPSLLIAHGVCGKCKVVS